MPPKALLEIACFDLASALIAQNAGANRIELCEDYSVGGISPSPQLLHEARKKLDLPLHVMVRPRPGNFVYSREEIQQMRDYISLCAEIGIDGVVFGALTADREVDHSACSQLRLSAATMSCTFHRAVDECAGIHKATQAILSLGFHRILTAGAEGNALIGIENIKDLQKEFGQKIIVMPGGGIRASNLKKIMETGCKEYHSSAMANNGRINAKEIEMLRRCL